MKELPHGSPLPENFIKKSIRFAAKKAIQFVPPLVAIPVALAGCGEKNSNQKSSDSGPERASVQEQYGLPFPIGETWFLTSGPHGDGYSNGIPYGMDIAPPEGGFCPEDGKRFTIENRTITASASGEVIIAGKDNDRNDPHHSEVRIKDKNGLTQIYIHLDKTKVKVGDKVKQGAPLGSPSCEFPKGGRNTGPHLHIGLMKDGQAIPIDGFVVGGWTIHENGTMTKNGEKTRTANIGRCATDTACGGTRNDIANNPSKAVVAGPKDPILPISATIASKEVSTTSEKWQTFKSTILPFQIDHPSSWRNASGNTNRVSLVAPLQNGIEEMFWLQTAPVPLDQWVAMFEKQFQTKAKKVILKAENQSEQNAWEIDSEKGHFYIFAYNGVTWAMGFNPEVIARSTQEKMMQSFKLLDNAQTATSATEKQAENKISISKKPDELFRALLTNPISSNILPQGMISRGASAGEIDATGKALKQIGAVTIAIEDSVSILSGKVFYGIFPDSPTAKSASELLGTHFANGQVLKDFPYPTKIYTTENNMMGLVYTTTTVLITSVENVTVITSLTGNAKSPNADLVQSRTIELAKSAIKHLGKVGK